LGRNSREEPLARRSPPASLPATRPTIVSRDTFDRVQKRLEPHGKTDFRNRNKRQPFGTILRCAKCDRVLVAHAGGSGFYYYKCPTGSVSDGHGRNAAEVIEIFALGFLGKASEILEAALSGDEWRRLLSSSEEVAALARDLAETEKQAEALAGQVAFGGIVGEKAPQRADNINARHAELAQRHKQATQEADNLRSDLEALRASLATLKASDLEALKAWWRENDTTTKRDTFTALYSKIAVAPDQITFSFRRGLTKPIDIDLTDLSEIRRLLQRSAGFGHNKKAGDGAEAPSPSSGDRTPIG
jgi:hypothetical protein